MKTMTPLEIQAMSQSQNVTLLDVRTPVEFAEKHIDGSQHIPLDQLEERSAQLNKKRSYVLVCASGKRAEKAYQLLSAAELPDLQILANGIQGWESAALPLIRSEKKTLPLIQQVQLTVGVLLLAFSLLAYFVNPAFVFGATFLGVGLTLAGSTGWCGLGMLLSKMPWNRTEEQASGSCCAAN